MTRYPAAIWRPGPAWKQGYGRAPSPPGWRKRGLVAHSAEGYLDATLGVLHGPRQASWHLTNPKTGPMLQHYPLEAHCWHAGDADDDDGVAANLDLVGIEDTGVAGEPLTESQIVNLVDFYRWAAAEWEWPGLILYDTGWEHNWVSDNPTACPSGRIPWDELIRRLNMPSNWPIPPWTVNDDPADVVSVGLLKDELVECISRGWPNRTTQEKALMARARQIMDFMGWGT